MIINNLLNIIQFGVGYLLFCILLPSCVLHEKVKEKPWIYRIVWYQVCGNLYLIALGFFLSYLKLFYRWTLWIGVMLPIVVWLYTKRKTAKKLLNQWNQTKTELQAGIYGNRKFLRDVRYKAGGGIRRVYDTWLKGNLPEIILVLLILVFTVSFFGEYKLTSYAYGHTDEETHLYWVQYLVKNKLFPAGMYPHGMHFLIGEISVLLGISPVESCLNFAVLSTVLVFLSFYFLMRTGFKSKYAAWIGWTLFVIGDVFYVTTYFRYQFTFPMEFGLVSFTFLFIGLIYYVREKDRTSWWLFVFSLVWSFQAHFYITIFAGVICVAFGLVFLIPMIKKKILHKVLLGGMLGLFLAVLPYGIGYAKGYEFERSIDWALGVLGGRDMEKEFQTAASLSIEQEAAQEKQEEETGAAYPLSEMTDAASVKNAIIGILMGICVQRYSHVKVLLFLAGMMIIYGIGGVFFGKKKEKYLLYLFFSMAWIFTVGLCACYFVGLPVIIEVYRAASFLAIMSIPLLAMPFQLLYDLCCFLRIPQRAAEGIVLAGSMLGLGFFYSEGLIKTERYYEITATEADMYTCRTVMKKYDDHTWTVISPTNDLSAIINNGYHYEIIDLIDALDKGEEQFYIPTRYVFVVVENRVMQYYESRREIDRSDVIDYTVSVSEEKALSELEIPGPGEPERDRLYYFYRSIIMSRLYLWMEKVKQVFPNAVSVYYKDDCCTVYKLEQDEYFLLNLALDYREELEQQQKGIEE